MQTDLKQSYKRLLESLTEEFEHGDKSKAFELLCAVVAELLKELP